MSSRVKNNDVFNAPYFWANEFVMNNFEVEQNIVAHKYNTYNLYKRYATKHNKGNLTLEEFNEEIIQIPNVKSQWSRILHKSQTQTTKRR